MNRSGGAGAAEPETEPEPQAEPEPESEPRDGNTWVAVVAVGATVVATNTMANLRPGKLPKMFAICDLCKFDRKVHGDCTIAIVRL